MPRAPLPPCEESRLRTLNECQVLDTEPEDVFDDITSLAAQLCESSMAFVSLVDTARLWFKSAFGSGVRDEWHLVNVQVVEAKQHTSTPISCV